MLSGYTAPMIHHSVSEPGMVLLEKPFTPDGLARKVPEVLDTPTRQHAVSQA